MSIAVLTAGETMARLLGPDATRLRHAAALELGVGGAESNVAVGLSRLGHRVAWFSRLGDDEAGKLVLNRLRGEGVETGGVKIVGHAPTGLFLRERAPEGARGHYYRAGSAASTMSPEDIDTALLRQARILHVTGITPALSDSCASFTRELIRAARGLDLLVSLDVNFRSRFCSAEWLRDWIEGVLPETDVVFASAEEAAALWPDAGEDLLDRLGQAGPREVVLKGDGGDTLAWSADSVERAPLVEGVTPIDTVGAGDAFAAGYLDGWLRGLPVRQRLVQGNAMGALCVMGVGDYEALPDRRTLDAFVAGTKDLGR